VDILTSPKLAALDWLRHGFGTRRAPLSQEGMASLKQIHSAVSFIATHNALTGDGDALLAREPGVTASIRTADCYPILLADPGAAHAVAAIHAGWHGTDARIVQRVLERMQAEFGTRAGEVVAAIGPGIGACCYEVGEEVGRKFGMPGPGKLDLAAANLRQLIEAGVDRRNIDVLGGCTKCDEAQFHSWRRDAERAGRMISFIGRV